MRGSDRHLTDQELLLSLDQELPGWQRTSVEVHLDRCVECRTRREQVDKAARGCAALYQSDLVVPAALHGRARERLRAQLNDLGRARDNRSAWPVSGRLMSMPRWAMTGAALVATALLIQVTAPSRIREASHAAALERGALPSATLTPGVTWNISVGELCAAGTREQREIPVAVRQQVLRSYTMEAVPPDQYELDYLITPELGGAPDPRNLWPQPYASQMWNAHVKDQLEQLLPRLVCDGRVRLETAQRDIARDWVAAYRKYFKTDAPLQVHAHLLRDDDGQSPDGRDLRYPVWRSASAPSLELVAFSPGR